MLRGATSRFLGARPSVIEARCMRHIVTLCTTAATIPVQTSKKYKPNPAYNSAICKNMKSQREPYVMNSCSDAPNHSPASRPCLDVLWDDSLGHRQTVLKRKVVPNLHNTTRAHIGFAREVRCRRGPSYGNTAAPVLSLGNMSRNTEDGSTPARARIVCKHISLSECMDISNTKQYHTPAYA